MDKVIELLGNIVMILLVGFLAFMAFIMVDTSLSTKFECVPSVVVDMNHNLDARNASFSAALKHSDTNQISIIDLSASPEIYYSLHVGDTVKICESLGFFSNMPSNTWRIGQ